MTGIPILIYVLLPVWQAEFGLGYAELGLLRVIFTGAMAALQIPAGWLASRLGTAPLLAAGAALVGAAFCLAGVSGGVATLALVLLLGGIGASTQHPLAAALVARAFAGGRSLKAYTALITLPLAAALQPLFVSNMRKKRNN